MKKTKIFRKSIGVFLVSIIAISFMTNLVIAAVDTTKVSREDVKSINYQVINNSSLYKEPVNLFDDGGVTNYYYVTTADIADITKDVTIGEKTYTATVIKTGEGNKLSSLKDGGTTIFKENATVFFEAGDYVDDVEYYDFSRDNLSMVGLGEKDSNNEPSVVITRAPASIFTFTSGPSFLERRGIQNPDVYIENITFSGGGLDMSYHRQETNTGVLAGGSRGEYFFSLHTGSNNFVMKNCVIKDVGANGDTPSLSDILSKKLKKNIAINFLYPNDTNGLTQINIEDVTIKNNKVQTGYASISTNQSNKIYLKNISIDVTSPLGLDVAIMHSGEGDGAFLEDVTKNSVVMAGSLSTSHNAVVIQDYKYETIVMPMSYRYTCYSTDASGSITHPAFGVFKNLAAIDAAASITLTTTGDVNLAKSGAVLDRVDNYWVVREGLTGFTVTEQFEAIRKAREMMTSAYSSLTEKRNIPPVNVKIIVDGNIDSFTLPDFGNSVPVNIVAVSSIDTLYNDETMVSVDPSATFNLGINAGNVTLHNFDFDKAASLTYHEALSGIATGLTIADKHDVGYATPDAVTYTSGNGLNFNEYAITKDAIITGTNVANTVFSNCRFTQLAQTLVLSPGVVRVDETASANGSITAHYTAPTAVTLTGLEQNSLNDNTIRYYSSNTSIATVVETTGQITGVAEGTVTIYAKACDSKNNGEIEKPYATKTITVLPKAPVEENTLVKAGALDAGNDILEWNEKINYTITFHNASAAQLTNVVIKDTIPDHTTYVAGSISDGGNDTLLVNDKGTLKWELTTVDADETIVVSFTVVTDAEGANKTNITNKANVTYGDETLDSNEVVHVVMKTNEDHPQTGDTSNMELWLTLLMLSTVGLGCCIIYVQKSKKHCANN